MGGKVRDASWLIGPLLLFPAIFYLNVWNFENRDFLKHARRVTATIADYQWGLPKEEWKPQFDRWNTFIEFHNERGVLVRGVLLGDPYERNVGDKVDIYTDPRHPDYRLADGLYGIFTGLYFGVSVALLGLLLSGIALLTSNRRPVETEPSYLDYWGGDDDPFWSIKAKADEPPERDVLD